MKQKMRVLLGSFGILLLLVSCNKEMVIDYTDPQAVVASQQEIIGSIIAGELTSKKGYKKLVNMCSQGYLKEYPKKQFMALLHQYEQYQEVDMCMQQYEIQDTVYQGDQDVEVFIKQHYNNGLTMERKITLVKEREQWRIQGDKIIR
ncbi:MAG: DUF4878 domain-containing protein [Epulopiscium sp.]|nr:DUF4878 domain-containing protein [Candidatus Epulonipiscium sp.]